MAQDVETTHIRAITATTASMQARAEPIKMESQQRIEPVAGLLTDAPLCQYLVEHIDGWRILWRVSEGEPTDAVFEPAVGWPWRMAYCFDHGGILGRSAA
jgi:hypothetical protein